MHSPVNVQAHAGMLWSVRCRRGVHVMAGTWSDASVRTPDKHAPRHCCGRDASERQTTPAGRWRWRAWRRWEHWCMP